MAYYRATSCPKGMWFGVQLRVVESPSNRDDFLGLRGKARQGDLRTVREFPSPLGYRDAIERSGVILDVCARVNTGASAP